MVRSSRPLFVGVTLAGALASVVLAGCGSSSGDDPDAAPKGMPACPEKAGQTFTYDQVVYMNEKGCMQSDGSQAIGAYGGACPDGSRFAYKNLTDLGPDPDGKDDYAYVVATKDKPGTVVVDKDGESAALTKLQEDCM